MAGVINGIFWGDGVGDGDATVFLVGANHATKAFLHKTHAS